MRDGSYDIESIGPRRLRVRLRGNLSEDTVDRLSADLLPRLQAIGTGGEVIIDLQQLSSCSTTARMRLVECQRHIATHAARTAFVANRPRFRGIGLWVAHISDDPNARAFHTTTQAQAWLRSTEGRVQSIASYLTRALKVKPQGRAKRSSEELIARIAELRDSSDDEEGS